MILRLRTGNVELRVVPPSSCHDVALDAGSRKSVDGVSKYTGDSKTVCIGRSAQGRGDILAREAVIDPVKPYADRQIGSAYREGNDPAGSGNLGVAQLSNRYGRASTNSNSIGLLTSHLSGEKH